MRHNSIVCGNCLDVLPQIEENSVDLIITSPPYNIKMEYDVYVDDIPWDEYYKWCEKWLSECLRVLKPDGRMALNHYLSFGNKNGRTAPIMELNHIALSLGFKHHSLAVWTDSTLSRRTAWGCYDDETSVMTKEGFKLFKDVDIEKDLFATIDNKGYLEWQKANNYIKKEYKEDLLYITNENLSLAITPDHNIAYYKEDSSIELNAYDYLPKDALIPKRHNGIKKDYPDKPFFCLPSEEEVIDCLIETESWLLFFGIFLKNSIIHINEEKNEYIISFLRNQSPIYEQDYLLLKKLPFLLRFDPEENEYQISDKQLALFLSEEENYQKILDDILNLSIEQKRLFINGLFYGDIQDEINNRFYLKIFSNKLFKIVSVLLAELNYSFTIEKIIKKEGWDEIDQDITQNRYKISITETSFVPISDTQICKNKYEGTIYCVSVPNKTLFVSRKGKTCWCGNSWLKASAPYISSPFEGILFLYKDQWKKMTKGVSDCPKEDFIQLTGGIWKIKTEKKGRTPANFNIDLPIKCIRLLSYVDSVILDPFSGSGTTAAACLLTGRKYIGIEISEEYCRIAKERCAEIILQNEKI